MLCSMRVLATPQVAGAHLHDTEKPSNQVDNHLYQYAECTRQIQCCAHHPAYSRKQRASS